MSEHLSASREILQDSQDNQMGRRRRAAAGPDSAASASNPESFRTTADVASELTVGKRTVETWIAAGKLRVVRFSRRCVRIRRRDLDEFIRSHLTGGM